MRAIVFVKATKSSEDGVMPTTELIEAMDKNVPDFSVENFYYLARTALVKDERNLDKFDRVFGQCFNGLSFVGAGEAGAEVTAQIPEEWLRRLAEKVLSEEEKAMIEALGGWDKLINRASTTWRALPEGRKSPGSDPEWTLLLKEHPALVKRPVLVTADGTVSVGFTDNAFKLRFGVKK